MQSLSWIFSSEKIDNERRQTAEYVTESERAGIKV
jgi:hypothetical protein